MSDADSTLRLDVTHAGLGMEFKELPFSSALTLAQLKEKLYPRTGTEPRHQRLTLKYPGAGRVLEGDACTLRELGLETGSRLELVDTNEASVSNTLHDGAGKVAKVEAKSGDAGFAAFRKKRSRPKPTADTERAEAAAFSVGQRVTTKSGKLATVRFVGPIEPLPAGFWVGVELDEATGRNDGEVKGVRLFTCDANRGAVARPSTLTPLEAGEGKQGKTDPVADDAEDDVSDTEL